MELFFPRVSRLLLSVRVLILKEHENLHVHFEDCVGRRVETAFQGRFWSLLQVQEALAMPSTLIICFLVAPLPYAWNNTVFCSND